MAGISLPSIFCLIFPKRRENDNIFDDFLFCVKSCHKAGVILHRKHKKTVQ